MTARRSVSSALVKALAATLLILAWTGSSTCTLLSTPRRLLLATASHGARSATAHASLGSRRLLQQQQAAKVAPSTSVPAPAAPAAVTPPAHAPRVVTRRPVGLVFGDSITEYGDVWVAQLSGFYRRKMDVINRGLSGYNSRWARILLGDILAEQHGRPIDLVVLMFGSNDATEPYGVFGGAHVPVQEYRDNMAAMVEMLRSANVTHIVLMTPPPVDDAARVRFVQRMLNTTDKVQPDRSTAAVEPYANATISVAAELGVPCVDLFARMQDTQDWGEQYFRDGLHPNGHGEQRMFSLLSHHLMLQPSLSPFHLPQQYPDWFRLGANPVRTLATLPLADVAVSPTSDMLERSLNAATP